MNFNNSGFIAMTSVFKVHQGLELLLFACSRHRGTILWQPRQANEKKGNKQKLFRQTKHMSGWLLSILPLFLIINL